MNCPLDYKIIAPQGLDTVEKKLKFEQAWVQAKVRDFLWKHIILKSSIV